MLSRVAEAVYWMSRYIERAENVARFVDVSLHLSLDLPFADAGQWAALVATAGDEEIFREKHGDADREKVLDFLTFDRDYPSSVIAALREARDNARAARDVISSEMWEQINKAYLMVSEAARTRVLDSPHAFYSAVKQASHLFVGATDLTMTHNSSWHFARLGRLLERADKTSRILDVKSFLLAPATADGGHLFDETQWAALLRSASAFEMYRKRHGLIDPVHVTDFLMFEREFPRSILFCLTKAARSLKTICGTGDSAQGTHAERALGRLHAQFEYAVTRDVLDQGVHEYIDDFQTKLNALGDFIATAFFAPPPDRTQLVVQWRAEHQQ
ncbi:MAG TPA: alpha-E domain-containing protein [Polyangiaceae bacterium]